MAYEDPKLDHSTEEDLTPEDLNRIERNIRHLKSETGSFEGVKTFTNGLADNTTVNGQFNCSAINTGPGVTNVFRMDQNVRSVDNVEFNSVETQNVVAANMNVVNFTQLTKTNNFGSLQLIEISAGGNWVVPRGIFMAVAIGTVFLQLLDGSVWQGAADFDGGVIISDGTRVRILNFGSGVARVYYFRV